MIVLCRKEQPAISPTNVAPQPSSCRLLALPTELRNAIWEFLLIQPSDDDNDDDADSGKPLSSPSPRTPASPRTHSPPRFCANVLRTCKQIHLEGTPILYGANLFAAHPSLLTALPSFLLRVRPPRATLPPVLSARYVALIRHFHVHVRLDTDPRFSRAQCAAAFAGCAELDVEVFQASYGTCDFEVLALFDGVRGVERATVRGSVGDGRYAAWLAKVMMRAPEEAVAPFAETAEEEGWDAWTKGNR